MKTNLYKLANKINTQVFNNRLCLSNVDINWHKNLPKDIAGITFGYNVMGIMNISSVSISSKFCKSKKITKIVLTHELVHAYQVQLNQKMNHNSAFMRYYEKKARAIGIEIDMRRY